jgi:hypothetical protein
MTDLQDDPYFSSKAGYFLNALMMAHGGDDFLISLGHLPAGVTGLGFRNTRNVTIDGDVPWSIGQAMESGQITLTGSCGDNVGSCMRGGAIMIEGDIRWGVDGIAHAMEGGEIMVRGDVEGDIGSEMRGGRILVMGDVVLDSQIGLGFKEYVGALMRDGEIDIRGDVIRRGNVCPPGDTRWIGRVIGGRVSHKGKVIIDK